MRLLLCVAFLGAVGAAPAKASSFQTFGAPAKGKSASVAAGLTKPMNLPVSRSQISPSVIVFGLPKVPEQKVAQAPKRMRAPGKTQNVWQWSQSIALYGAMAPLPGVETTLVSSIKPARPAREPLLIRGGEVSDPAMRGPLVAAPEEQAQEKTNRERIQERAERRRQAAERAAPRRGPPQAAPR